MSQKNKPDTDGDGFFKFLLFVGIALLIYVVFIKDSGGQKPKQTPLPNDEPSTRVEAP